MFDKNYLGHDLIKNSYYLNRYYCEKCSTTVMYNAGCVYSYLSSKINHYEILDISCDEMIIKGLLE